MRRSHEVKRMSSQEYNNNMVSSNYRGSEHDSWNLQEGVEELLHYPEYVPIDSSIMINNSLLSNNMNHSYFEPSQLKNCGNIFLPSTIEDETDLQCLKQELKEFIDDIDENPRSNSGVKKKNIQHNVDFSLMRRRERNRILSKETRERKKQQFNTLQRQFSTLATENKKLKSIIEKYVVKGNTNESLPIQSNSSQKLPIQEEKKLIEDNFMTFFNQIQQLYINKSKIQPHIPILVIPPGFLFQSERTLK